MTLSPEQKAHYWAILVKSCTRFCGAAGIGSTAYQHIGFVIGPTASPFCAQIVRKYAETDAAKKAPNPGPEELFDAILNTHRVRATDRPNPAGIYFEIWSAYQDVHFDDSEPDRKALIEQLDLLESTRQSA